VEDKHAGTACVLNKFRDILLTFPVTGVRCTKKAKDGLSRVERKLTFHGEQTASNYFCGVSMASLRAEGTGTTKVPWKSDFNELSKLKTPWGVSLLLVTNPKHVAYGRLCTVDTRAHGMNRSINGSWKVILCDTEDDWTLGKVLVNPAHLQVPSDLSVQWTEVSPVILDHQKYQWLQPDQFKIMLQSLILDVQRGGAKWSQTRRRFYRTLCESWRRYQNKRRIQYKKRMKREDHVLAGAASVLNPGHNDHPVETALVGEDRPKRGARAEAERRLASILPGEPGATVAPPPGLEPVEEAASETGEMETLAPIAPPEPAAPADVSAPAAGPPDDPPPPPDKSDGAGDDGDDEDDRADPVAEWPDPAELDEMAEALKPLILRRSMPLEDMGTRSC
jgi:hypothetical protein